MKETLYVCAGLHLVVAVLNLSLPYLLGWRAALTAMPALVREVFHVHAFYLSLTLVGIAAFTFAFVDDIIEHDAQALAFARFVAVFWAVRVLIQLFYYSAEHYRGRAKESAIHAAMLLVYGGMSAVYFAV